MALVKEFKAGEMTVRKYDSRSSMAESAGSDIISKITELLKENDEINIIFAAAPSQSDTLEKLVENKEIDWSRINAYHMDEYVGLAGDAPQGFGNFLKRAIFDKVPFKSVNLIGTEGDADSLCERYSAMIDVPIHIVCLGIGENGHIAFNDPPVADFSDSKLIKKVELDEKCRIQQVHDGCFEKLDEVPTHALTLTVPMLMRGENMFCVVPAKTKAQAVKDTVELAPTVACPATILKTHRNAILYCDNESGSMI